MHYGHDQVPNVILSLTWMKIVLDSKENISSKEIVHQITPLAYQVPPLYIGLQSPFLCQEEDFKNNNSFKGMTNFVPTKAQPLYFDSPRHYKIECLWAKKSIYKASLCTRPKAFFSASTYTIEFCEQIHLWSAT
nr:hypothetical protein [Tanacetum cinerariifolium]